MWDEDESETVVEYTQYLKGSPKQSDVGAARCVPALSERISA